MSDSGDSPRFEGTSQAQRLAAAPDPSSFRIDDRSTAEYLRIVASMASQLRLGEGTWRELLPGCDPQRKGELDAEEWQRLLSEAEARNDNPPHLALLITFLRLFRHAQDHLNELTKAHLDHFYRHVLGFRPRLAQPDRVLVFPSLAKGVESHRLPSGTVLDAGKDDAGHDLRYVTDSEIVVTRARVASVLSSRGEGAGGAITATGESGSAPGEGLAISSPLLFVQHGQLTVWITFRIASGGAMLAGEKWKCLISAEGGWHETQAEMEFRAADRLLLRLKFPASVGAIVAVDPEVHGDALPSEWPALKLFPLQESSRDYLCSTRIGKIQVRVETQEGLTLRNDYGRLDSRSVFQPFGPRPVVGSTFTVELEELKHKPDAAGSIDFIWIGMPEKFVDYSKTAENGKVSFRGKGEDSTQGKYDFTCTQGALFGAPSLAPGGHTGVSAYSSLLMEKCQESTVISLTGPEEAFGHNQYAECLRLDPKVNVPEPYTPTAKSCTLIYVASAQISTYDAEARSWEEGVSGYRLIRLSTLGCREVPPDSPVLPSETQDHDLYVGIADHLPSELLHLHFAPRGDAGGDAGEAPEEQAIPPVLELSYLCVNGWRTLPPSGVRDGTQGLTQPGIVSLALGPDAVQDNPSMPPGLHWIRVRASAGELQAAWDSSMIRCQAVGATLRIGDTPPAHLGVGSAAVLPPGSVKGLESKQPAIAAVAQPLASFGGRAAESDRDFYARASERLRHRNRAVTPWDYEHLVLEAFPEVHKVLCLPTEDDQSGGEVKVVMVPRSDLGGWENPLQPRLRPAQLEAIRAFLQARASAMARIKVMHPRYEELKVRCKVTFKAGDSDAYYRVQLIEDLKRFLSPWAYDRGADVVFGSCIYPSVIQAFLMQRDYVQHLTDFDLWLRRDLGSDYQEPVAEKASGTKPWSVLVSAPTHDFENTT